MLQACDSGWRCDIKCRALAHTRKCAFFPLVSIPCFCDQRERNLTGDVLPDASRQCSVRLQQSAHVSAFSLLSSSTVPVCWSCADSSTHLRWLKTSSWWKKTRCRSSEGRCMPVCDGYNAVCWRREQREHIRHGGSTRPCGQRWFATCFQENIRFQKNGRRCTSSAALESTGDRVRRYPTA